MEITVAGRKMPVTASLREYAEEKIGNSMKVMDIEPLSAEIVLFVEKNPSIARPAACEVTLYTKGHIIRVEEHEEDMYAAIDVAAAKVLRQLRKFKTRVLDRKNAHAETIREMPVTDVSLDELMDELSADLQAKAVGVRTFPTGFEALVKTEDTGAFTALSIEPATIDEIVVFTSKKGEDHE